MILINKLKINYIVYIKNYILKNNFYYDNDLLFNKI